MLEPETIIPNAKARWAENQVPTAAIACDYQLRIFVKEGRG